MALQTAPGIGAYRSLYANQWPPTSLPD